MLFFGKRLPNVGVSVLCVGSVGLSFLYALCAVSQLLTAEPEHRVAQQVLFEWLTPAPCRCPAATTIRFVADWGYLLDPLSCVMVLVVTGVGFLIHVYSIGYMGHESGYYRLLRLHESLHVRHAHTGPREQHAAHVRGLGRRSASAATC